MATHAIIETKRCPMHEESCAARVAEHLAAFYPQPFTAADGLALLERTCGRYRRGKRKGQLRGWATIKVCTRGGWRRHEGGGGGVCLPGAVVAVTITDFNGNTYLAAE